MLCSLKSVWGDICRGKVFCSVNDRRNEDLHQRLGMSAMGWAKGPGGIYPVKPLLELSTECREREKIICYDEKSKMEVRWEKADRINTEDKEWKRQLHDV